MTLVRKGCPFLEAKSAVAQFSEFFELGSDIKRLFGSILELIFPSARQEYVHPEGTRVVHRFRKIRLKNPIFVKVLCRLGAHTGARPFREMKWHGELNTRQLRSVGHKPPIEIAQPVLVV